MMMRSLRYAPSGFLLLALLGCAPAAPAPHGPPVAEGLVPVGVATMDITPAEPIRLAGYPSRRDPTAEVRQRLRASALAFGDERPAVLVSAELVGVPAELTERVARRLAAAGVGRADFALAVTHTHSGPSLAGVLPYIFGEEVPPEQRAAIDRYTEDLASRLERVALDALADRRPARLGWGVGRAGFAANRRVIQNGRWTGFGVNPEGPVDHDLPVMAVREPDGRLRAVLLGYAAHATTLEGKENFIHGDWPGAARQLIEQRHPGATAMVVIGAGADANPAPRGGGLSDVMRNATEAADAVERLLGLPLRPITAPPRGALRVLHLPLEREPTRAELRRQAAATDAAGMYARDALRRLDQGEAIPREVPYPVQAWAFGDHLAMVFLGGEVVAEYALRLKRELDASRLWVNAYTNDVSYYVASRRMIPEGGYEVDRSMTYYGFPSRLADATEEIVIRAVREVVPEGFLAKP